MTRQECENLIIEKLKEIDKIHKEYNPNGDYLSMCILNNDYNVNNEYWDDDTNYPIQRYYLDLEFEEEEDDNN